MPEKVEETPQELRARIQGKSNSSLYFHFESILGYKAGHPPLHQDVVCRFLQEWDDEKFIKLLMLPREHLKSTLGLSLCNWLWTVPEKMFRFPSGSETRILLSHGKREMAIEFLSEMKSHQETDETYRWVFPHLVWDTPTKDSTRWKVDRFDVRREEPSKVPSILASGTNAAVTGFHFDWMIFDDLVFQQNVGTPELRRKTLLYFQQCQALLRRGGRILVIGTRWHWDDLYGTLLDPQGPYRDVVDSLVLSSGYDEGEPIYPISEAVPKCGFDMERLEQRRQSMGRREFEAQYNNRPVLSEAQSFKKEDISRFRFDLDGNIPTDKALRTYVSIDPNRSTETQNDPCVILAADVDEDGQIWGRDMYRGHPTGQGIIEELFRMIERHDPYAVILETTAFQLQLKHWIEQEQIRRKKIFTIIEAKRGPTKRKHDRVMALQPLAERGGLHLPLGSDWDLLVDELVHFGTWKHDDIADAMADVYQYSDRPSPARHVVQRVPNDPFVMKNILEDLGAQRASSGLWSKH